MKEARMATRFMRQMRRSQIVLGVAVGTLLLAATASSAATRATPSFSPSSSIQQKVQKKQALNFVLSFQILNEPSIPQLLEYGMAQGAKAMEKEYGVHINTRLIAPPDTNPPQQISQITQVVNAHQADCVAVEPVTPGAFVRVINDTMSAGVPVMTVNTDSPDSKRLAYFGANDTDLSSPTQLGQTAGRFTVAWAHANHINLNGQQVALISGDTTAPWAQGRMAGWVKVVKAAFPKMQLVGTPTHAALSTGYVPATVLSQVSAYMTGHPNIKFYFSSDTNATQVGQVIAQRGLKGKVFTMGFNVNSTWIQNLQRGTVIGTVDQRYDLQAETFVEACARLLLKKQMPAQQFNYVTPSIWTPASVSKAVAFYKGIPGSGI
jgi:ABC-type sugar transport system substrate-binding protein